MQDKETIYDELLAPLVSQVIEICKAHGIPMFATFQYSDDGFCTSIDAAPGAHPAFSHYEALRRCIEAGGVNIDKYMNWNARGASETGHSSTWLALAGIPPAPPNARNKPIREADSA